MPKKKVSKKKVAKKPAHPKFVFVGNGKDDPETIEFYGYTFALNGKPVAIPDPFVAAKAAGNSHFKVQ